tara:strand:+ start:728 stop:2041 length:1314 start_codon:yes stop_codon:yes gene_type:complete
MPLDPNIAMGYRGVELQNPLNALAQFSQIQNAQNQNAMAQLQMREAEATAQEKNMLRRLDPTAADYESQLFKVSPQLGINYRKEQAATEASKAATASSAATAAKTRKELLGQALRDISERPSDANITAHTEDIQASPLFSKEEKAKALITQQTLLAIPFEQRQAYLASQGASASELKPSTQTVNRAGSTDVVRIPAFSGAPTVVGSYADVPLPAAVEEQKKRIARESRPPVQPVAPTITQIVDPTNPNQMIAVDARRYQGGGAGSPGVIGVGGKEPGAALRTNKVEEGKSQLANDLDNLRSSFTELDRLRAIPSTERNVVSNLMSATAASGVGQALGRAGGSPEQVERDVINSARQRLVASIKNATGMSSKSLDSNMELQTMLRSISDPGQSVEAAMRIIDDIEAAYVKGSGTLPKPGKPPAAVAPNIDALLKKYEK